MLDVYELQPCARTHHTCPFGGAVNKYPFRQPFRKVGLGSSFASVLVRKGMWWNLLTLKLNILAITPQGLIYALTHTHTHDIYITRKNLAQLGGAVEYTNYFSAEG